MHRIGGIQAVQVRRDKSTEVGEVLAKTIKQALGRDLQTIRHQSGEAVRTTVAHRYKSEEASLPKHDLQAVEVGGRVRPTLRHANVPAFRGDSALTASLRTVERNPSAPTTRSYSPVLSSSNSTFTASARGARSITARPSR